MTSSAFFITGTDTDIGKTTIATALLYQAKQAGLRTLAMKPIASGCTPTPFGLRNNDALQLQAQCSEPIAYEALNPYAFEPAIAPHLAAAQANQTLSIHHLRPAIQRVLQNKTDFTLIEGAGGWHVPLNNKECLSDLARSLNLPIILVVGIRLGCLNHALLTVESIQRSGLRIAGWVANHLHPQTAIDQDNQNYLAQHFNFPLLGSVPFLESATPANVSDYLHLNLLF